MCLNLSSKPRSHKRALLSTTAIFCSLALMGPVHAVQEKSDQSGAPIVQVAEKKAEVEATAGTSGAPSAAAAALARQSDVDNYPASFFEQYSPQNALDMVRRLPGFSFDRGSNARGFGGTAGNVLIDGSRPTSKSGGLEGALQRIPAAQVERIEIMRGGVSGGEAGGQSTVANVIRKQTGSSGTWNFKTRHAHDGSFGPNIEAAISSKLGAWDTTFDIDIGKWVGYRTALIRDTDENGALVESSDEILDERNYFYWSSGEASRQFAGGKLTLNGRIGGHDWSGDTVRDLFGARLPDASPDGIWQLDEHNSRREAELGVDWTRTFNNNWKWRLIGLGVLKSREFGYDFADADFLTGDASESSYVQDRDVSEYILRTTYGLTAGKFKPEFGIEGARNQMDNEATTTDSDGTTIDMVTVREFRGEAFATFNYQMTEKLSLDGGMTYEASQIKVSGENPNEQTVKFWKPRLSATYAFNSDIQLTLEAEREVGQLDFGLFAASSSAVDDRDTGGNSKLRPDTKWRTSATLDWQFSDRGSLKIKGFHQWRSDILEEIELDDGSFGRGNAGSATFYGIEADLTIPTDGLIPGGLLEVEYDYRGSDFDDPILGGLARQISGYKPESLEIEFRQDLTDAKVSWGVEFESRFTDDVFLVDSISRFQGSNRLEGFIETTRFWGVKMKLIVNHLTTSQYTRSRFVYDGTRAGDLLESEVAARKRHPDFRFEISGTF